MDQLRLQVALASDFCTVMHMKVCMLSLHAHIQSVASHPEFLGKPLKKTLNL